MAITETRTLPAQFIEDIGRDYAKQLSALTMLPVKTEMFKPTFADQDPLQTAAYTQATDPTTGLGAYQPYLTKAGEAATAATGLTGAMTDAQTTAYMSPYQKAVTDIQTREAKRQQEQARQQRQTAAAVESFRNETINQQELNRHVMSQLPVFSQGKTLQIEHDN